MLRIQWDNRSGRMDRCEDVVAVLSRYLDKDVRSADATRIAAHLHNCLSCGIRYDAMRAQQANLRSLPTPVGGNGARQRVLNRLEAAARSESPSSSHSQAAVALRRSVGLAALGATITVGVVVIYFGHHDVRQVQVAAVTLPIGSSAVVSLPASGEMATLFELHDRSKAVALQAATVSTNAAATPVSGSTPTAARVTSGNTNPSLTASSYTTLPTPGAAADQSAVGMNGKAGSADPLSADDVPEAL